MDISEICGWLCPVVAPLVACTFVVPLSAQDVPSAGTVVMSTRAERSVTDEPVQVEVLEREAWNESLVTMPNDLATLLGGTAGLRVQPTNALFGGAGVRIWGLRGRYTSILTDGLPLYGSQSGSLGLLQIPVADIEQIEVIGGAASALYGATALGGVVNLISRRPVREREFLRGDPTAGGGIFAYVNQTDPARAWGGELRVRYGRQRLHVTGTYAYARATESAFECLRRLAVEAELDFPCQEQSRREVPRTALHSAGRWRVGRTRLGDASASTSTTSGAKSWRMTPSGPSRGGTWCSISWWRSAWARPESS